MKDALTICPDHLPLDLVSRSQGKVLNLRVPPSKTGMSPTPKAALNQCHVRCTDYLELVRPRIAFLVLFSVATGFGLASGGAPNWPLLLSTLFGTSLVVAGASALNQCFERHSDAQMERTACRPIPAGRLDPVAVLSLGACSTLAGLLYLAVTVQQPMATLTAAIAFVTYVYLYTPLKRMTTLNTLVGAIPGALPPVIGWTAVTNSIDPAAIFLFAILFLWQVPHFLAIAWIYRDDYAQARLQMLPVQDPSGTQTARRITEYCLALVSVSLLPSALGLAGPLYLCGATALGIGFLASTLGFWQTRSQAQARSVLRASLVYLPALLMLPLFEGMLRVCIAMR